MWACPIVPMISGSISFHSIEKINIEHNCEISETNDEYNNVYFGDLVVPTPNLELFSAQD